MRQGLTIILLLAWPWTAHAFRTTHDDPEWSDAGLVRWSTPPSSIAVFDSPPSSLTILAVHEQVRRSVATWSAIECSAFEPGQVVVTRTHAAPGDDQPTVELLRSSWRDLGLSADVAATTDLTYVRDSQGQWQITDADILVNALDFSWTDQPSTNADRELGPVITHEFGHLLGLLHVCEPSGAGGAPACEGEPGLGAITMHPIYFGTEQASLHADDVAGACFLYPLGACDSVTCPPGSACVTGGACAPVCGSSVCRADQACIDGVCQVPPCEGAECPEPPRACVESPTQQCGAGAPGDPCDHGADCATGECAGGRCHLSCDDAMACPPAYACTAGACLPDTGVFGDACLAPSDCASSLCIREGDASTCTRSCADDVDCPGSFVCAEVSGRSVCRMSMAGGCSVGVPRGSSLSFLSLLFVAWLARRRTR